MDSFVVKDGKKLRLGYTTGSCAAAAAKAAAIMLLSGRKIESIRLTTPKGIPLDLPVTDITRGDEFVSCAIRKDSGDDPDVTDGAMIYAKVTRIPEKQIIIDGGSGVGRVTKRGLDQPVGAAAINSVPRRMIRENLEEVCGMLDHREGLSVIISVPDGEKIAQKTFNPRMGIIGGISILGTSGIVDPMSEQALTDTIRLELKQRRAEGKQYALLTPGNYGKDFLQKTFGIDPAIPVMTSNFIGDALDGCRELEFRGVLLVGHIGKLVKTAGGMLNTHSRYGDCRMEILAAYAAASGLSAEKTAEVLECAACDDALRICREEGVYDAVLKRLTARTSAQLNHRTAGKPPVEVLIFSNVFGILGETENARTLLEKIKGEY